MAIKRQPNVTSAQASAPRNSGIAVIGSSVDDTTLEAVTVVTIDCVAQLSEDYTTEHTSVS